MNNDPRFIPRIDDVDGQGRLRFMAADDITLGEAETPVLLEISLAELLGLGTATPGLTEALAPGGSFSFVLNGWQSWSWAGEREPGDPVGIGRIKRMRLFSEGPARRPSRKEVLSYFYLGIEADGDALFVVSRNEGGAPLAFRTGIDASVLKVEALAGGARYKAGDLVAELRVFCDSWLFGIKDQFRLCFAGFRHFDKLAFLGHGGNLVPGGYESWYNHYTHIDEGLIRADLEGLAEPGNLISDFYVARGKPTVFQIDDGWELGVGDWTFHPGKFPGGMASMAQTIEARGYIPGLWVAPFLVTKTCAVYRDHQDWILRDSGGKKVLAGWNPNWDGDFWALDLSVPEVGAYLEALFEEIVEDWGYRYLKLDFLYAAFLPGRRRAGGAAFEHWERLVGRITSRIRTRSGKPVAWLGCGAPLESSYRHFPLMRIGADTREAWEYPILKLVRHEGRPAAYANLMATVGRNILDGTVFVNDPDVVFCRESNNKLTTIEKEAVALVDILLASQVMFSDGAADVRSPEVKSFTAGIIELADTFGASDFGAIKADKDVFLLESRDGRFLGILNLSSKPWRDPNGAIDGKPLVAHEISPGLYAPHSISIYEV